jgi:hypothetical protein
MDITVVCVWYNTPQLPQYKLEHVLRLKSQVSEALPIPHKFVCLTNNSPQPVPGITFIPIPTGDYFKSGIATERGWWAKMELFNPQLFDGRVIYFDLDVTIVGSLTPFAYRYGVIDDWHLSPGYNTSVISWLAPNPLLAMAYFEFKRNARQIIEDYPGDQDFLFNHTLGKVPRFPKDWCVSYKTHCQDGVPPSARVVVYHGSPKPWELP